MTDEDTSADTRQYTPDPQNPPLAVSTPVGIVDGSTSNDATSASNEDTTNPTTAKEPLTPGRAAKFAGVAIGVVLACTVIVVAAILMVSAFGDDSDDRWREPGWGSLFEADSFQPVVIVVLGGSGSGDGGLGGGLGGLLPDGADLLPYILPLPGLEEWLDPESLPDELDLERFLREFDLQDLGTLTPQQPKQEPKEATPT